ncbi:MAG: glycosyltransferase family 4 protein [Candidatus Thorarchaeota archaeon]|jgi:glycosyltransferase involved in cell wall biosynthesis
MERSPTVLMVSPSYLPAIGGVEKHVETISKRLQRIGYKISILTVAHGHDLQLVEYLDGIRVIRMPFFYSQHPLLGWLWVLLNRNLLINHDIIHVHDTVPLLFWWLPIRLLYPLKRATATFHGFERDPIPFLFVLLRKIANRVASSSICIGNFIETKYRIKCGQNTVGAVESDDSKYPISLETSVFVGRLERDTGIMDYLDALTILRDSHGIELPLRIVGEGQLLSEIEEKARVNNIKLEIVGIVDNPKPFVGGSRFCFAAGYLSILEALNAGVPVVGLARSPLKHEYLLSMKKAGAPISVQQSPEKIASEISRLLSEPGLYDHIQRTGRSFASKMKWSALIRLYANLWKGNASSNL